MKTPQKSGLEALWARAGQAGHLRLEVESVRVAEQERSLAEARQHLEEWDHLVTLIFQTAAFHPCTFCATHCSCYTLLVLDASFARLVAALPHAVCASFSPSEIHLPRLDDAWPAQGASVLS